MIKQVHDNSPLLEFIHRTPNPSHCALPGCTRPGRLFACERCKVRFYCSVIHQRRDWAIHQQYCPFYIDMCAREPCMKVDSPLHLGQRIHYAQVFLEDLQHHLSAATYPKKDMEGVWGIEHKGYPGRGYVGMDYPVSELVYHAWAHIHHVQALRGHTGLEQFNAELIKAMLTGHLPYFFKKFASAHWGGCVYCSELVRRDFRGISWDKGMHNILAGRLHTGEIPAVMPRLPTASPSVKRRDSRRRTVVSAGLSRRITFL